MYDAINYIYVAVRQFPKSEKFCLAAEIKSQAIKIIRLIIAANKSRSKFVKLYEIDVELEILKLQTRMAMDLKFLPFNKYEILSRQLVEVGKMLGGWIKCQG